MAAAECAFIKMALSAQVIAGPRLAAQTPANVRRRYQAGLQYCAAALEIQKTKKNRMELVSRGGKPDAITADRETILSTIQSLG